MKKIGIISIILFIVALASLHPVNAENATITYKNAKSLGMGDAKVAGGFGYNGFIDNPALLSRVKYMRLSLFNIPITFNKHTSDVGKFINDNTDKFQNFDTMTVAEKTQFLNDVQKYDGKWARINFSPLVDFSVSLLGQHLGLAVYETTNMEFKTDRGIYEPRVWGQGDASIAAVVGYARPLTILYPGLVVGANLKYIQRSHANLFQIKGSDLGNIQDTAQPILDDIKENVHKTMAADVGALLDIPFIDSEVALVAQSIGDGRGSAVNLGIAKRMYGDHLTLLGDYIDFFDNNKENIFNKIHVGAEYKRAFLAFRAGLNSGYPTVGFGLNFKILDIDAAYFTEELGNAPGENDDERYVAQIKLGW